ARSSRGRRLGALLQGPGGLAESYRAYRGVFAPDEVQRLVAYFTGLPLSGRSPDADDVLDLPADPADCVSYLELTRYMRNQLLRDSDVMSMAHGLELRLPLVDQRLFDTVARIPPSLRLQPGKRLLVDAVGDLPESVTDPAKRGFAFPFQAWFGQSLGARLGADAGRLPVQPVEWYQQWAILVFTHWFRACRHAVP
ncbi:asparagine synthase-related protein, partial [Cognatilysobacter lacus]